MDIYSYIMRDHAIIKDLFERADRSSSMYERGLLFKRIKNELSIHAEAEEAVFYASFVKHARLKDKKSYIHDEEHAEDDHEHIRRQLVAVEDAPSGSFSWDEAFKKLHDIVNHHVHEEETSFFKEAREVIPFPEAQKLAHMMDQFKRKLQSERSGHEESQTRQWAGFR